jgi:transposase
MLSNWRSPPRPVEKSAEQGSRISGRQALDTAPSLLAGQTFHEQAHGIVFQDYLETVWTTQERRDALIKRISAMVANWSLGPLVEALRGLRGIDLVSAATFITSTGDLSRFESPRLLMGYLGLVPSEHSSGGTIRRGGITKTGNREARRMLIEAAWSYQYPARIAKEKAEILVRLPKAIRDIAWKAQTRLCTRYRSMVARGKTPTVVVAAIARELAGFIWAICQKMKLSTV